MDENVDTHARKMYDEGRYTTSMTLDRAYEEIVRLRAELETIKSNVIEAMLAIPCVNEKITQDEKLIEHLMNLINRIAVQTDPKWGVHLAVEELKLWDTTGKRFR